MEAPRSSSTGLRHRSNPARVTAQSVRRPLTDDASEFSSAEFERFVERMGARHLFIRAGRSQTNGCVERVQQTILDECWKPAFARYLIPKYTGLSLDLNRCLRLLQHRPGSPRSVDQGGGPRMRF